MESKKVFTPELNEPASSKLKYFRIMKKIMHSTLKNSNFDHNYTFLLFDSNLSFPIIFSLFENYILIFKIIFEYF